MRSVQRRASNWVVAAVWAQLPPLPQCRGVGCPLLALTRQVLPLVRVLLLQLLLLLLLLLLFDVVVGPPGVVRLVWPMRPVWLSGVLANTSIWPKGTRSCLDLV